MAFDELANIGRIFEEISQSLRTRAEESLRSRQFAAKDFTEFEKFLGQGMISTGWCGGKECAAKIEAAASILSVMEGSAKCVVCGRSGKEIRAAKTY